MGMGFTAKQIARLQALYTDTILVQQYAGKVNQSDNWLDLGYCNGKVYEKASISYKGTSQAQASDATVELIKAPAVLTSRNDKFRLVCDIMPSDVELYPTQDHTAPILPKRTVSYEIQNVNVIRDFGGSDVVMACKCVLAKRA